MNNREQRAAIAQDTLSILNEGHYTNLRGDIVQIGQMLRAAIEGSVHYSAAQLHALDTPDSSAGGNTTEFQVSNETTLSAARRLYEAGHEDVLCLNFASARNPGGGFMGGSEAQEENLAKSSGLYPCIVQMSQMYEANRQMKFCAYLDDMIYSPRVPVFRNDDYGYLDEAWPLSIVTAPAVNRGAVARNEPDRLGELEQIMLNRIALLLRLARHHGHSTLVLGAWGCGVFANRPADMANWFARHLLHSPEFQGVFRRVEFAVLDRRNGDTWSAFADVFGDIKSSA